MIARSRNTGPISSHASAAHVETSGIARGQQRRVLAALALYPNRTSNELAVATGMERHMVAKRLPELRADGLVVMHSPKRRDHHTNRWAVTWVAV